MEKIIDIKGFKEISKNIDDNSDNSYKRYSSYEEYREEKWQR